MEVRISSLRCLQILLTLFYGQVFSTGIYEYLIQGICGLILRIRPKYDSILLIVLAVMMFAIVVYAMFALWYRRIRMLVIVTILLIFLLALTLAKSITEITSMGLRPTRTEWIVIRTTELVLRLLGILASVFFIVQLRQGYEPKNF